MKRARPAILVIDDDASVRDALVAVLDEAGYDASGCHSAASALQAIENVKPRAVLLDIRLRDGDGLVLLSELLAKQPALPIIMATAFSDSGRTITAMRDGAFEYLTKPFDFDLLLATVARAVNDPPRAQLRLEPPQSRLIGESAVMREVWKAIGRAAASSVPVLITGESGVGKELVAHAIHEHGKHNAGAFVAVNIAALPGSLIESELFGHERGAFTGAGARRAGRFELSAGGTLFLDEIGDLDLALQTKLLRVLDGRRFEPVGSDASVPLQARIIAATSKPVIPRTPGAALREDLYYRLSVLRIEVPPLREHRDDIPGLVTAFLHAHEGGRRTISQAALQKLQSYAWPGNVRELKHAIDHACIMSSAQVLDAADIVLFEASKARSQQQQVETGLHLATHIARTERAVIERALEHAKGNRTEAARLLGIRRALLYTRMRELGLPK